MEAAGRNFGAGVRRPADLSQRDTLRMSRRQMGFAAGAGRTPGEAAGAPPVERLAQGLALFSVGLGAAQVLAPAALARLTGVGDTGRKRTVMFGCGWRELAAGVGIFVQRRPTAWLWARVAGDVMDLALLVSAFGGRRSDAGRIGVSLGAVAGVTALDVIAAVRMGGLEAAERSGRIPESRQLQVRRSVTINRAPDEVYAFWRDLRRLPQFMVHLAAVEPQADGRSEWRAKGPFGIELTWQAEVTEDVPNELLSWRSLPGSQVTTAGTVTFSPAPAGQGTQVDLEMVYDVPGGRVGAALAKLLGKEPGQQINGDLRRLKQVLETGEVLHSDASVHGGPHPARPAAPKERINLAGKDGGGVS